LSAELQGGIERETDSDKDNKTAKQTDRERHKDTQRTLFLSTARKAYNMPLGWACSTDDQNGTVVWRETKKET
jgi:hypothetical protein